VSDRKLIRTTHPYGFRCGQWAEVLTIAPDPEGRDCYIVRFPDGTTDYWVVTDPDGGYEHAFTDEASA
jgi:hypothetical protein